MRSHETYLYGLLNDPDLVSVGQVLTQEHLIDVWSHNESARRREVEVRLLRAARRAARRARHEAQRCARCGHRRDNHLGPYCGKCNFCKGFVNGERLLEREEKKS